ncbi:MAG: hypothetical protein ACK526_18560 [Planctomyces sp.]
MKKSFGRASIIFAIGVIVGGSFIYSLPQQSIRASVASGNDKFTMVTVPVSIGETEAVFVLNHLTGILSGAVLSNSTGAFNFRYVHDVASDFKAGGAGAEPKYAIVSAPANLRSAGGMQPANGVIFIGELSSGAVIAYTFAMPRGRGADAPIAVTKGPYFRFAEPSGG